MLPGHNRPNLGDWSRLTRDKKGFKGAKGNGICEGRQAGNREFNPVRLPARRFNEVERECRRGSGNR